MLLPDLPDKRDGWRWGTVTQVGPVRVRLDGDSAPLLLDVDVIGGDVLVGARVYCHLSGQRGSRVTAIPKDPRARAVGSFTASSGWGLFQGAVTREWTRVTLACRFDRLSGSATGAATFATVADGFRPPFTVFGGAAVFVSAWTPAAAYLDPAGALTVSAPGLTYTAAAVSLTFDQSQTA